MMTLKFGVDKDQVHGSRILSGQRHEFKCKYCMEQLIVSEGVYWCPDRREPYCKNCLITQLPARHWLVGSYTHDDWLIDKLVIEDEPTKQDTDE